MDSSKDIVNPDLESCKELYKEVQNRGKKQHRMLVLLTFDGVKTDYKIFLGVIPTSICVFSIHSYIRITYIHM